jgi:hypothetical protein
LREMRKKQSRKVVATKDLADKRHDPPRRDLTVHFPFTFRYQTKGAMAGVAIRREDMLAALLIGYATATTGYCLLSAVRVKAISMWTATSGSSNGNLVVQWAGLQAPQIERSDATISTAQPAYLRSVPDKFSDASYWSLQGVVPTEILCFLYCPTDTIIDVQCDCVIGNTLDAAMTVHTTSTTSLTDGVIYNTYLDVNNGASAVMQPLASLVAY